MQKILYKSFTQEEFTIWGDGTAIRDYIYIGDLIKFLIVAGLSKESGTFNVGSGEGRSINEILQLLSPLVEKLPPIKHTATDKSIVQKVFLDISAAKEVFNWEPKISLEEGIAKQNEWMKILGSKSSGLK